MSRIAKNPVIVPVGVEVTLSADEITRSVEEWIENEVQHLP